MSDGESCLGSESDDDGPVLAAPPPRFAGRLEALAEVYSGVSDEVLISQPNDQTLEGSFSSVSTPNFASKYSLESS